MNLLRIFLVNIALAACALGVDSVSLAPWIAELASDNFRQRLQAEEQLFSFAKANPKEMQAWLKAEHEKASDPEVRLRLARIMERIAGAFPVEEVTFSEVEMNKRSWLLFEEPKEARYFFEGEVLEFDSTAEVRESLAFVHRFELIPEGNRIRFGAEPKVVQRMVLDAEIKVLSENHIREGLAGVHLNVEDQLASHGLMIQENGIFAYQSKWKHKMNTTDDWHHYRFVIEGGKQWIYVDDMDRPLVELERMRSGGRKWVSFGDSTTGAGARAQIRNVRFARFQSKAGN